MWEQHTRYLTTNHGGTPAGRLNMFENGNWLNMTRVAIETAVCLKKFSAAANESSLGVCIE